MRRHAGSRLSPRAYAQFTPKQQVRRLTLHEYQSLDLLREYNAPIPRGRVARTPEEARLAAQELGGKCIVNPQILHRRRHNGSLDNDTQHFFQQVDTSNEAQEVSAQVLKHGSQAGDAVSHPSTQVYISEAVSSDREWYLAMTIDRETYSPAIILSSSSAAATNTDKPITIPFRLSTGITPQVLSQVTSHMSLSPSQSSNLPSILTALYEIFTQKDATLLEVGRLALLPSGRFTCLDASFSFDDAAHKRQPRLFALRDTEQEVSEEVEAEKYGLVYVRMEGDIGNVVNGAGLAMATNDAIGLYGGKSANFLDGGGQATKETMVKAFGIIMADERVKVILVNIYGGITDGRMIAESIIGAASELGPMKVPVVVRLQGTNSAEGLKMLEEADLGLHVEADFGAAAKLAVELSKNV